MIQLTFGDERNTYAAEMSQYNDDEVSLTLEDASLE